MKYLLSLLLLAYSLSVLATGNDHKPKKNPPPVVPPVSTAPAYVESDLHKQYFWGGAAMGGLAITALQKSEHPWLYATGGCAFAALVAEKARSGAFDSKNARYGVGGCAAGATGIGLTFGKDFFKWEKAIKF